MRGDASGHFALDHDNGSLDGSVEAEETEQNFRGDVVGQIADDQELFFVSSAQRSEVDGQNVLLENFDRCSIRKLVAQAGGQVAIQLDGHQPARARSQKRGDRAASWANFDDGAARHIAERIRNRGLRGGADEKVLAQFWLLRHPY